MASGAGLALIVLGTILSGFLAGGTVDRIVVQMPAWHKVGVHAWAAYSRHADLRNGLILYPLEAIGSTLLIVGAAVINTIQGGHAGPAALPLYLSVALALGGLLATTRAAPKMLSLGRIGEDMSALEHAFQGFERWGAVRALFQVAVFLTMVWSLLAVTGLA